MDTSNAASTVIATVTVDEAFTVDDSFESAAQYRSLRMEPGTYTIERRCTAYDGRKIAPYHVLVTRGVVTSSGYGGDSRRTYHDEIGTEREHVCQLYDYQVDAALESGSILVGHSVARNAEIGIGRCAVGRVVAA